MATTASINCDCHHRPLSQLFISSLGNVTKRNGGEIKSRGRLLGEKRDCFLFGAFEARFIVRVRL